jgi:hypothetical protein
MKEKFYSKVYLRNLLFWEILKHLSSKHDYVLLKINKNYVK